MTYWNLASFPSFLTCAATTGTAAQGVVKAWLECFDMSVYPRLQDPSLLVGFHGESLSWGWVFTGRLG